jgi:SAM-dependent methyltransferase
MLDDLLRRQCQVLSRTQAIAAGFTHDKIKANAAELNAEDLGAPAYQAENALVNSYTDRSALRERLYAGPGKLAARQRLWSYRAGESLIRTALDVARLRGDEAVLDGGCGNGAYLAELRGRGHRGRVVGVDLSAGMAAAARIHAPTLVGDITALPFADGSFAVGLAMHMLYHVPSIPAAVAELRRVIRPGGTLLAATNGARHTREVTELVDAAAQAVTGRVRANRELSFTLENGRELLATAFEDVRLVELPGEAVLPGPDVLVDYIASVEPENCGVRPGDEHQAFLREVDRLAQVRGIRSVTSHPGVFVSR